VRVIADDGGYLFERRPAGKYTCTVTSEVGPATGEATVAGATRLDLSIGTWGSITGVVINALTGAPMPGLKLVAMGASGMPAGVEELLGGGGPTTDATGRFDIGKQTAGTGRLMIFSGGLTGIDVIASKEYKLANGQRLDLGTIKGLPPRVGPAGALGLTTTETAGKLTVEAVVADGPAARAGVKVGDVVVSIDGRAVADLTAEIADDLLETEHVVAGQVVKLGLSRGGATIEATVTADPVPE
jgi:membrane-associated protease RseP (regulator of RpoE activity)